MTDVMTTITDSSAPAPRAIMPTRDRERAQHREDQNGDEGQAQQPASPSGCDPPAG